MKGLVLVLSPLILLGASDAYAEGAPLCTPGSKIACECMAGQTGYETCMGDGTYSACACSLALTSADDAGADIDGCIDFSGAPCKPLACDGALCDTTNGSTCDEVEGRPSNHTSLLALIGALGLWARRNRQGRARR
jgi:hypothetical protein